jgi:membrane-bound serine protease (ClpP class)
MNKRLTLARLVIAVITMAAEQAAIWVIWRFLLPEIGVELGVWVVAVVMAGWLVIGTWLFIFTTRTLRRQAMVGLPSMVGSRGKAAGRLAPDGIVKIKGELWSAVAEEGTIEPDESIIVTGEDGLKLKVRSMK